MSIDQIKARFEKYCNLLKDLGFNGKVFVSAGMVMIVSLDKPSASMIRKGFKKSRNVGTGEVVECRFGAQSVFVWVDNPASQKVDIRESALLALKAAA
jgi:hypothetical protein